MAEFSAAVRTALQRPIVHMRIFFELKTNFAGATTWQQYYVDLDALDIDKNLDQTHDQVNVTVFDVDPVSGAQWGLHEETQSNRAIKFADFRIVCRVYTTFPGTSEEKVIAIGNVIERTITDDGIHMTCRGIGWDLVKKYVALSLEPLSYNDEEDSYLLLTEDTALDPPSAAFASTLKLDWSTHQYAYARLQSDTGVTQSYVRGGRVTSQAASAGGSIPDGDYRYFVTAVVDGADGLERETYPSEAPAAAVTCGSGNNTVTVTFDAVTLDDGAGGTLTINEYRIYRIADGGDVFDVSGTRVGTTASSPFVDSSASATAQVPPQQRMPWPRGTNVRLFHIRDGKTPGVDPDEETFREIPPDGNWQAMWNEGLIRLKRAAEDLDDPDVLVSDTLRYKKLYVKGVRPYLVYSNNVNRAVRTALEAAGPSGPGRTSSNLAEVKYVYDITEREALSPLDIYDPVEWTVRDGSVQAFLDRVVKPALPVTYRIWNRAHDSTVHARMTTQKIDASSTPSSIVRDADYVLFQPEPDGHEEGDSGEEVFSGIIAVVEVERPANLLTTATQAIDRLSAYDGWCTQGDSYGEGVCPTNLLDWVIDGDPATTIAHGRNLPFNAAGRPYDGSNWPDDYDSDGHPTEGWPFLDYDLGADTRIDMIIINAGYSRNHNAVGRNRLTSAKYEVLLMTEAEATAAGFAGNAGVNAPSTAFTRVRPDAKRNDLITHPPEEWKLPLSTFHKRTGRYLRILAGWYKATVRGIGMIGVGEIRVIGQQTTHVIAEINNGGAGTDARLQYDNLYAQLGISASSGKVGHLYKWLDYKGVINEAGAYEAAVVECQEAVLNKPKLRWSGRFDPMIELDDTVQAVNAARGSGGRTYYVEGLILDGGVTVEVQGTDYLADPVGATP